MTSKTNDVGCVETSIPWEVNGGPPGFVTFFYTRPSSISPESLTNNQLKECGLTPKPSLRTQMKGGMSFQNWEALVRTELQARQPTPWLPHVHTDPSWKRPEKRKAGRDTGSDLRP
jgi:hypothetical protein